MRLQILLSSFLACTCTANIDMILQRMTARRDQLATRWVNGEEYRDVTEKDKLLMKLIETKAYKDLTTEGKARARRVIARRPLTDPLPVPGAPPGPKGDNGPPGDRGPPAEEEEDFDVFAAADDTLTGTRIVNKYWQKGGVTARTKGIKGLKGQAGEVPLGEKGSIIPSREKGSIIHPSREKGSRNNNEVKLTPEKKAKKVQESLNDDKLSDLPMRKEYRCLTMEERDKFHSAINQLKQKKVGESNAYDIFVLFHFKAFAPGAYKGPAFLPWHRHFLWLFEKALREVSGDETIVLPYWDTSADGDLPDPLESSLWKNTHMGTSKGNVVAGPFANWKDVDNNPLKRNVSGDIEWLYNEEMINYVLSSNSYGKVVDVLELTHAGLHSYVGGHMSKFESAVMDPVFFMHQAFVDCLWEEWREKEQYKNNIDPETQYPDSAQTSLPHRVGSNMSPFEITNRAGLARVYTSLYYKCQPRDSCPNKCGCDRYNRDCDEGRSAALEAFLATAPPSIRRLFTARADTSRNTCD